MQPFWTLNFFPMVAAASMLKLRPHLENDASGRRHARLHVASMEILDNPLCFSVKLEAPVVSLIFQSR